MLTVLGIFVLLVLPSVIGLVHDRRVDRQIREAQEAHEARREPDGSRRRAPRHGYFTTTSTHHS
jgi:hypothetical protein